VRLAAKLTGWKIDIKSEEEKRREVEAQFETLELPSGDSDDSGAADAELTADGGPDGDASGGTEEATLEAASDEVGAADRSSEDDAAEAAPEAAETSAAETTRAER
jgi:hypothetical protein